MELSFSNAKVLPNPISGKKSEVSVVFSLKKGDSTTLWDWEITITVTRNGYQFSNSKRIRNSDVYQELENIVEAICNSINTNYNQETGCNVDSAPIVEFVQAQKAEFEGRMREAKVK